MELRVDQLAVARGGITVLEGVSFSLPAGRGLVLRGPNGIGKTTLLRTVAGLQPAVSGAISAGGGCDCLCRPCRWAEGHADRARESGVLGLGLRGGHG